MCVWGGGLQNGGGHVKFYTYEKGGGAENVLTMLKFLCGSLKF